MPAVQRECQWERLCAVEEAVGTRGVREGWYVKGGGGGGTSPFYCLIRANGGTKQEGNLSPMHRCFDLREHGNMGKTTWWHTCRVHGLGIEKRTGYDTQRGNEEEKKDSVPTACLLAVHLPQVLPTVHTLPLHALIVLPSATTASISSHVRQQRTHLASARNGDTGIQGRLSWPALVNIPPTRHLLKPMRA